VPDLRPQLSERWALQGQHLLIVGFFCLFFLRHNYLPLFHSDVWGHVSYGDWILRAGRLPAEEPFVELAAGVPVVASAWLSQVVLALTGRAGDAELYSHLFAVTVLLVYLVLARAFYLQCRSAGVAVLSAVVVWGVVWSRHAIIRPEMFGGLCFAVLIWVVVKADERRTRRDNELPGDARLRRLPWGYWVATPALFALWANLHGSFVVGFAVLGCYAAGRAIEVLWRTRDARSLFRDQLLLRWLTLSELAVLGTLANPYGFDLIVYALAFSSHPNLKDIVEWFPLEMVSLEGIPMAASWVLTAVLLRHSRARMTPSDVLLLALFNLAVCLRVRMIAWYAPVLMLVLTPHLADVVRRLAASDVTLPIREVCAPLFRRSFRLTLIAGLLVWVTFAFSPISRPVLGGKPRRIDHVYSHDTPLGVTEYLRLHPPQGTVAAPQWWGDWLVLHGPPRMQLLTTTNSVHLVPPRVWKDYLAIAAAAPGLERRLNRYRVNTIVVGKSLQKDLQETVERLAGWEVAYEDDIGIVAVRKHDPAQRATPEDAEPAATTLDEGEAPEMSGEALSEGP
jgi:hypothetical protein